MTDEEPQADDQPVPEGLELRKDGTILAVVDGERYRLRRPKIGEYRKLLERRDEMSDNLLRTDRDETSAAAALAGLMEEARNSDVDVEVLIAARNKLREASAAARDLTPTWVGEVFDLLGDRPLPSEDERPSWFVAPQLVGTLLGHWRAAPLVRGGH